MEHSAHVILGQKWHGKHHKYKKGFFNLEKTTTTTTKTRFLCEQIVTHTQTHTHTHTHTHTQSGWVGR